MLRAFEKSMQRRRSKLEHFSRGKVFLPTVKQFVPKIVDWRIRFPDPFPEQNSDDCNSVNVYRCFEDFGQLINKDLVMPYRHMLFNDFRNTPSGGSLTAALQQGMLRGIYSPRNEDDAFRSFGEKVPLSGYFRLPPMNEEFFIRAVAQQPVLATVHAGDNFQKYKRGEIFRGETQDFFNDMSQYHNHAVTAVAYTEETIVLRNSSGIYWGDNGDIVVERGHTRGVNELYSNCYIPFMYTHMTDFNEMLLKMNLQFDYSDMTHYGARDLKTMLFDKTFPIELKAAYMDDITEYWNEAEYWNEVKG